MKFLVKTALRFLLENISLAATAIVSVGLLIYEPLIFDTGNILNILKQTSLIAIFALAQSIVLISKELDLSQGGTITFTSVCVALLSTQIGLPLAICVGLFLGALIGFVNGLIVSGFKVSSFVVTMGMGFLLQGLALVFSRGQPVHDVPDNFTFLGWHEIFDIPLIVFILVGVSFFLFFYTKKTVYGLYLYAIGSNERASYLSGINVRNHKIIAFLICGVLTALGAAILASRINSGHPIEGANTALQSVAAAVIGGVSLFGGKGKITGVLFGSLLLAFISNSLNIMNVSSYFQQVFIGVIIIVAVVIDKFRIKEVT